MPAKTQQARSRSQAGRATSGSAAARRTSKQPPAPAPAEVKASSNDHQREIIALVLLGVAVFLIFVLAAGEVGGVVGRGVKTALFFAFGRLTYLVPAGLLAAGAVTVMRRSLWRSNRFAGAIVFLFGLFLLIAAAVPPFGERGDDLFVRTEFETRAGGLGETFFALFDRLVGLVGVGIISWIALLAGFSLMTGITGRWLGRRTKDAANAVRMTADRGATATMRREEYRGPLSVTDSLRGATLMGFGRDEGAGAFGDTSVARRPTVPLGPVDLVGDQQRGATVAGPMGTSGTAGRAKPQDDPFEEWTSSRSAFGVHEPLPGSSREPGARAVVDGAEAYADIYRSAGTGQTGLGGLSGVAGLPVGGQTAAGAFGGRPGGVGAGGGPAGLDASRGGPQADGHEGGPALGSGLSAVAEAGGSPEPRAETQETLPGLGRQPRQIELPLAEPTYLLPEPDMLRKSTPVSAGRSTGDRDTGTVLLQALAQFGVEARIIGMVVGPRVTRYELQLAPGTKVARVSSLKDDLAYALATTEIRILTPIPGKMAVGVEIPNQRPDFVTLGDIYREFPKTAGPLMVWLGKDISGKAVYADLTKLPHLLIAGTTGSGKSGCVNCLVSSVLLRSNPEQVRMIMIDPKKVELSHYDRIPHLLVPVVTNMKDAAGVLHNVVKEMEDRYELMELDHTRSLAEMNKVRARRGERPVPYILIVIDELADLMMASPQEVEDYVIRLAQKSRAVGIHLVVATQRPSADVITGMIKANIPSRIAFAVSSQTDSRVILDVNGAETLLGQGDMLFKPLGSSHLERVQGAYITEEEIAVLVNHWRHQAEPEFREELLRRPADTKREEDDGLDPDSDELLAEAARLVFETGNASVSMLQRRLRVGYTRAGRLIDMLERRKIVGPYEGSKPRQVLVEPEEFEHVLAGLRSEEVFGDRTSED